MSGRRLFARVLIAGLLMVGVPGLVAEADAASAKKSSVKPAKNARSYVIESKRRGHSPRIYLPVGPSYIYHDYPYYYSRGYYPRHIVRYIYYPYYKYSYRSHYRHPDLTRRKKVRKREGR